MLNWLHQVHGDGLVHAEIFFDPQVTFLALATVRAALVLIRVAPSDQAHVGRGIALSAVVAGISKGLEKVRETLSTCTNSLALSWSAELTCPTLARPRLSLALPASSSCASCATFPSSRRLRVSSRSWSTSRRDRFRDWVVIRPS